LLGLALASHPLRTGGVWRNIVIILPPLHFDGFRNRGFSSFAKT
jgi:hypothetical protein